MISRLVAVVGLVNCYVGGLMILAAALLLLLLLDCCIGVEASRPKGGEPMMVLVILDGTCTERL